MRVAVEVIQQDRFSPNSAACLKSESFELPSLRRAQDLTKYDLMYVNNGMLFWGARNVDGRGFEMPENRPTNLQIPIVRN